MKTIYVKSQLNSLLYRLIGHMQSVEQWWITKNGAFNNRTPDEVYMSGEEGKRQVAEYILSHCNYGW